MLLGILQIYFFNYLFKKVIKSKLTIGKEHKVQENFHFYSQPILYISLD